MNCIKFFALMLSLLFVGTLAAQKEDETIPPLVHAFVDEVLFNPDFHYSKIENYVTYGSSVKKLPADSLRRLSEGAINWVRYALLPEELVERVIREKNKDGNSDDCYEELNRLSKEQLGRRNEFSIIPHKGNENNQLIADLKLQCRQPSEYERTYYLVGEKFFLPIILGENGKIVSFATFGKAKGFSRYPVYLDN